MPRYDEYDNDDLADLDLRRRSIEGPRRQSGPGFVSFGLSMAATLGAALLLLLVIILAIVNPNGPAADDDPMVIAVGLAAIGTCTLAFAGLVVGVAGICQSDRNPVFAVLGVVINAVVLLAVLFCIGIGILAEM